MRLQWLAVKVVEETTAGALKLKELVTEGELFFFVINVSDCVTKIKFDDNTDFFTTNGHPNK